MFESQDPHPADQDGPNRINSNASVEGADVSDVEEYLQRVDFSAQIHDWDRKRADFMRLAQDHTGKPEKHVRFVNRVAPLMNAVILVGLIMMLVVGLRWSINTFIFTKDDDISLSSDSPAIFSPEPGKQGEQTYPYPSPVETPIPSPNAEIPEGSNMDLSFPNPHKTQSSGVSDDKPVNPESTEPPHLTPIPIDRSEIPWFHSFTPDGLQLVDAVGRERLAIPDIRQPLGGPMLVGSYAGSEYVVVPSSPEPDTFGDWHLDIIDLSSFEILDTIEGSADEWINSDDDLHLAGDLLINHFALSKDGRYLYFHAGIETPVAEIYRYDLPTKSIARLTDGDSHIFDFLLYENQWIAYRRPVPVPGTDRSAIGIWILDLATGKSKLVQFGDHEMPRLAGWTQAGYLVTYLDPLWGEVDDHQTPRITAIEPQTGEKINLYQPPGRGNLISRIVKITPEDHLVVFDGIVRGPSESIFPFRILEYDFNDGLENEHNEMVEIYHEDEIPIDYGSQIRDSKGNYYLLARLTPFRISPNGSEWVFNNERGAKFILSQNEEWLAFYNSFEPYGRVGLRLYDPASNAFLTEVTDEPVYELLEGPASAWIAYRTDTGVFSYHLRSGQTFPLYEGEKPESFSNIEQFSLWLYR